MNEKLIMWVIIDRIHMCVWISSKHVVVIVCVDDTAAAVASCSYHVSEQKQSC